MIYIANKSYRIMEFCKSIVAESDESRTITDKLSLNDFRRIKDGDTLYGSAFMSELFLPDADFMYINVVPPRSRDKDWKGFRYQIKKVDGHKAIIFLDSEIYEIKEEAIADE